jgi:hypothetical protein
MKARLHNFSSLGLEAVEAVDVFEAGGVVVILVAGAMLLDFAALLRFVAMNSPDVSSKSSVATLALAHHQMSSA